ncbi:DUF6011 domain-containing protein [Actinacidiphila acididurans]|uniref:Uncharacterized protein n=1 Tax=Actinacidiphila acididurans TaxID=2784346 RepID=A0ABS2U4D6_9ACTN|nr:DUF6011 domain-containing protein [Actinacidiphila acididurans]MBM9510016.1 hypothetical protein [Actinacidiphila acididurans]
MQDQPQLPLPEPPLDHPATSPAAARLRVECADCHRPLIDHTSRSWGRGPGCRAKHGDRILRRTDGHHIDQDHIPGT